MDFKAERERRGWSTRQVAEMIGFEVATINGLEVHGRGSDRLKIALEQLYGLSHEALREAPENSLVDELINDSQQLAELARRLELKAKKLRPLSDKEIIRAASEGLRKNPPVSYGRPRSASEKIAKAIEDVSEQSRNKPESK